MIYIMKQEGLYQSKVNSSLISIRNYMYSCTLYKMDYWWKRGAYRIWVHVCTCSVLIWRRLLQASGVLTIPLRSPGFYKAPSPWVSCELTLIWTGPFLVHVQCTCVTDCWHFKALLKLCCRKTNNLSKKIWLISFYSYVLGLWRTEISRKTLQHYHIIFWGRHLLHSCLLNN